MATSATSSFGTFLQLGDGGTPEVFATIAEVKDISGPALGLDTEEVTSHDSPGGWEEFVPTILRSGEVSFELNFLPTDATQSFAAGLILDKVNRTLRNFQIVFTDLASTTWGFAAYVVTFEPSAPVAGALTASVSLKITGQPTLA